MYDLIFDDPSKPKEQIDLFDRIVKTMIIFAYLRIAFMFVAPYCVYAWIRDAVTNVVSENKVYILERNPYLWDSAFPNNPSRFLPENVADGKVTCYKVAHSVKEALDWLRTRDYKIEELFCESDDVGGEAHDFFVKPVEKDGYYPAELESVVELVIDYGDSHTEPLCQQGKVETRGFERIEPGFIYLPEDIARHYHHRVVYNRYGGRLGPVEVIKRSNGVWYSQK